MKKKIYEGVIKPKMQILENMLIANGGEVFVGKTVGKNFWRNLSVYFALMHKAHNDHSRIGYKFKQ